MPNPLDLLVIAAEANHAVLVERKVGEAEFLVGPPLPSGAPAPTYSILVRERGLKVVAQECSTTFLPRFCPERHINQDGTFCLYSEDDDPHQIYKEEDAEFWWRTLLIFLRRQHSASALGVWPGRADARAHGTAARYQAIAEKKALSLGDRFVSLLRARRFATTSLSHRGERRIRLTCDGRFVAAVRQNPLTLMTKRARCVCDNARLPICSCGTHAEDLTDLIAALESWRTAELEFNKSIRQQGISCCGTISECPLAA